MRFFRHITVSRLAPQRRAHSRVITSSITIFLISWRTILLRLNRQSEAAARMFFQMFIAESSPLCLFRSIFSAIKLRPGSVRHILFCSLFSSSDSTLIISIILFMPSISRTTFRSDSHLFTRLFLSQSPIRHLSILSRFRRRHCSVPALRQYSLPFLFKDSAQRMSPRLQSISA